jgi:hypothetical protein
MKPLSRISICTLALVLTIMGTTAYAGGFKDNIAVRLVGTADAYNGDVLFSEFGIGLPAGEDNHPLCFDLDLVDVKSGKVIGSAADCLADIDNITHDPGITLTGTTFFFFKKGTVISQGLTTVQPILHGSLDFTHITGAIPQEGDDNVVYSDGKFKNVKGPVRLSGTVNLSLLPPLTALLASTAFSFLIWRKNERKIERKIAKVH